MASKFLKKQILIEFIVLLFFLFVVIYSYFAITNEQGEKLDSVDGVVAVLNDSSFDKLELLSDGQGLRQDAISYAVTNNNNSSKTYNVVMNYTFNTLVDLDIDKDGIYYYENLEVDINNEWKNNKDYWDGTACIVGEYTFKPFSFFKTEDQLVAFAAAKYKSLNNKYMALLNELNDKTAKTWKSLIIKKKQKKAKAKIRELQEDFE